MMNMKKRNDAIDILKFLAVVLILNSHFDKIYLPPFDKLATGGTIGDAMFFLCSGFTMLLGGGKSFANYYKKRIYRIYPSVIAWAIIGVVAFNKRDSLMSLIQGGWFVNCIMIYYIPIYFIKRYCENKVEYCMIAYSAIFLAIYLWWERPESFNILKDPWMKWWFLFFVMLLGAYLGKNSQNLVSDRKDGLFLILSLVSFHLFAFARKYYLDVQVLTVPTLMGICYYGYKVCAKSYVLDFYNRVRPVRWAIRFMGGLCLEIYLINLTIITEKLNHLFPLNVFIILVEIIVMAYAVRCLSRFLLQTFSKDDYRWKEVFQLII